MLLVRKLLHADQRRYLLPRLQSQYVGNRLPSSCPTHLGNLVNLLHIHATRTRKEHKIIVCRCRKEMLNEVGLLILPLLFLRLHPNHALATPLLRPIAIRRGPFDVPRMGQGDEGALLCYQVLDINLALILDDLGATLVRVLFLNLKQLLFDDRINLLLARQNAPQLFNLLNNGQILFFDLIPLQSGQLIKSQFKNRIRLPVTQLVLCDQLLLRRGAIFGSPDDLHEVVQMIECLLVPLEDVSPVLCYLKIELGPTNHHFPTMLQIAEQHVPHRH